MTALLKRRELVLLVIFLAGLGVLVWLGFRALEKQRQLRHAVVAERVFEEMERKLTNFLLEQENKTPAWWNANDGQNAGEPLVVRYFSRASLNPNTYSQKRYSSNIPNVPEIQAQQALNNAVVQRTNRFGNVKASRLEVEDDNVLVRTTDSGVVQGIELKPAAVQNWLEEVVDVEALKDNVSVAWGDTLPSGPGDVFRHVFAQPYSFLVVSVRVDGLASVRAQKVFLLIMVIGLAAIAVLSVRLALRTARAESAAARQSRQFVASVTHELRTPLASIQLYAEMLEQGVVAEEDRKEYLRTIRDEGQRLAALVDNVLHFESAQRQTSQSDLLENIASDVSSSLAPILKQRGATLTVDIAKEAGQVPLPHEPLTRILVNLLDNASKFAPPGSGRVVLEATTDGNVLSLTVKDNGPGVPENQLQAIFFPFFRLEDEMTRQTKGTGMGLAIVRELISELGGTVQAENVDQGFEVVATIPIRESKLP